MSTRIRAGLYTQAWVVDLSHTLVVYDIERNEGDYPGRSIGRWLVKAEVAGDQPELWDDDFPTKQAAEAAIVEVMAEGHYEYWPSLGCWCYVKNEENNAE